MEWQIVVLPTAKKHLKAILDQRVQKSINDCIAGLKEDPELVVLLPTSFARLIQKTAPPLSIIPAQLAMVMFAVH